MVNVDCKQTIKLSFESMNESKSQRISFCFGSFFLSKKTDIISSSKTKAKTEKKSNDSKLETEKWK